VGEKDTLMVLKQYQAFVTAATVLWGIQYYSWAIVCLSNCSQKPSFF